MKKLIVYSSLTGNTKKIAKAFFDICDNEWELKDVEENFQVESYQHIILGFWVNKGMPDDKMHEFIKKLSGKKLAFFMTLGAYPDSNHAKKVVSKVEELLNINNELISSPFVCHGALTEKAIEKRKLLPKEHPHGPNEENIKRWNEASKHPNEEDFKRAKKWFNLILENL